ncbi:MAG: hypothetical protein AB8G15_07800 [Saprospiraceae bacterium]
MGWFSKAKKRRIAMEEEARALKMSFTPKDEYGLKALFRDFRVAKQGHSHRARNILQRTEEKELGQTDDFRLLDYHYIIQAGSTAVPVMQTLFFVQSKQLELPAFSIQPRSFMHKVGQFLGFRKNQIPFPDFPAFEKRYVVKGQEETLVQRAIQPALIEFLLNEKPWYVEGIGYYLIFYNKKIEREKLRSFHKKGVEVFRLLKTNKG